MQRQRYACLCPSNALERVKPRDKISGLCQDVSRVKSCKHILFNVKYSFFLKYKLSFVIVQCTQMSDAHL